MAEVAEGALRLFSAHWQVRGSPYCGVQPLSVSHPIAEKFARHAWPVGSGVAESTRTRETPSAARCTARTRAREPAFICT